MKTHNARINAAQRTVITNGVSGMKAALFALALNELLGLFIAESDGKVKVLKQIGGKLLTTPLHNWFAITLLLLFYH